MREELIRISYAAIIFILIFALLQQLFIPKHTSETHHGNMIREYYQSSRDHNIIFIGDCEVFGTFSPVVLWEEFGLTSFVRGSAQQLVWQSYYILEETLRHERPDMIVFSVLAMQYDSPQSEAYNRLTLDGMRWSPSKIRAISASRTSEEDWLSYFLPFFRFKDRWREIGAEDFRYFFRRPQVSSNGFMIRADVRPVGISPNFPRRAYYTFGEKPLYYLERIAALAAEHDIPLVLIKAPTPFPIWHDEWEAQIVEFASCNNLRYINFLDYINTIGLDFSAHTFDGGYTLNVFGAEKVTQFFGEIITHEFDLPDRRGEVYTATRWADKSELYHHVVARQMREFHSYGEIRDFLMR